VILEKIVAHKRREVAGQREKTPVAAMERSIAGLPPCRPLRNVLRRPKEVTLVAEIKRASPSKGVIRSSFAPDEIARIYAGAGAAAISVLTETSFFGGHPDYIALVHRETDLPVLRKDFIIDPYQVCESRFLGSDAILLIAAILSDKELGSFQKLAFEMGLTCLVEVHTRTELERALDSGASLIGINNRDLNTFETDLTTTFLLRKYITDSSIVVVSESGIGDRSQMLALAGYEVDAALVGEALMSSNDIEAKVKELLGVH
jgi:indole-3-glycerol phosphate synthase (EC 4.1.1.48)